MSKKLRQISLGPQKVEASAKFNHDHGILEGASGNHTLPRTPSAMSGLVMGENIGSQTDVEPCKWEDDGKGELEGTSDSGEEPGNVQLTIPEADRRTEGYPGFREWAHLAVATVTTWWIELGRSPKRREVFERYGWVFGVVAVMLLAVLVGWWVRGIGRVPEGFVERGSPQWFRSRLHHGRRG